MSRLSEAALNHAISQLEDMAMTIRTADSDAWLERAIKNLKADNERPLAHPLDWTPIRVGMPADWYGCDEDGKPVVDAYGNPCISDPIWVEARKDGNGAQFDCACIGGSSAGAIYSLNPEYKDGCPGAYKSKSALYHELRGDKVITEEANDNDELLQAGHHFEDAVAIAGLGVINEKHLHPQGWHGTLVNDQNMYMSGVVDEYGNYMYPHAIADMDRLIRVTDLKTGKLVGYFGEECKTTSYGNTRKKEWIISDEHPVGCPLHYETQVHHYEAVCNIGGFFLVVQDHSMKQSDLLVRFIERNVDAEVELLDREESFIQDALNGIEPSVDEDKAEKYRNTFGVYHELYADNKTQDSFVFPDSAIDIVDEYNELKEAYEEAAQKAEMIKEQMEKKANELLPAFDGVSNAYGIVYSDPIKKTGVCYVVRAKKSYERDSYNLKRLYEENRELFEKCLKNISLTKKGLDKTTISDLLAYVVKGKQKSGVTLTITSSEDFGRRK